MSIINNGIRAWWIQKSDSCNIANKVEFCDFKPTVHDKAHEWIRVISLDDFHKQTNINITRWIEVCQELQKLKEQNQIMREALEFYADKNNWELGKVHSFVEVCEQDYEWIDSLSPFRVTQLTGGKRAREALAKVRDR